MAQAPLRTPKPEKTYRSQVQFEATTILPIVQLSFATLFRSQKCPLNKKTCVHGVATFLSKDVSRLNELGVLVQRCRF
ncbi:hypothetical protein R1flu_007925 [Riccia fluitans]|uniref:Uncharacterized protein n=1 Tax=Riccia fluitans TaxID=41844 RepID=A0ABD1Z0A7_9MARC